MAAFLSRVVSGTREQDRTGLGIWAGGVSAFMVLAFASWEMSLDQGIMCIIGLALLFTIDTPCGWNLYGIRVECERNTDASWFDFSCMHMVSLVIATSGLYG